MWEVGGLPVVSCPFLSEGESMLLDLVFRFQGASHLLNKSDATKIKVLRSNLSPVSGGVATGSELDPTAGFALHLQLDQTKVVAWKSALIQYLGPESIIQGKNLVLQHTNENTCNVPFPKTSRACFPMSE